MGSRASQQVAAEPQVRTSATVTPAPGRIPPEAQEALDSPGQDLDPATRAFMERRFGQSLCRVCAHGLPSSPTADHAGGWSRSSDEREADRVAEQVVEMTQPSLLGAAASRDDLGPVDDHADPRAAASARSMSARALMEPRLGHDFGQVRVHADAKAAASARALNARAFTFGREIVFGAGQYAPQTAAGRRLLAHELAHVVQQSASPAPRVQAFTAELDQRQVMLRPEKGDTDADLDRVVCPAITNRKIAGRTQIDITECLPRGTVQAMTLGPENCARFVDYALAGATEPGRITDLNQALPNALWEKLRKRGARVASFAILDPTGKVTAAQPSIVPWKQISPAMGDLVFMSGQIVVPNPGPHPEGDDFIVSWSHVGFFLVRSRKGFDYHLAKDGDENPIGVFHTGMALPEGYMPGAYVKGAEAFMAYLRPPPPLTAPPIHGEVKVKEGRDLGELPPGP
jgi:hypothetical protein